jgi:predicted alpha/beta hydrolase
MQATGDSFLGWVEGLSGRSYYVRQLRDMKWSPDPATLTSTGLHQYALMCGHTLARAHARSGDAVAIAAYLGSGASFDRAMAAFATSYADQVQRDFAAFTAAISHSRITAVEEASGGEGLRGAQQAAKTSSSRKHSKPKAVAKA